MAESNLVGKTILGYTAVEKINSGTFGTVYKVVKHNPSGSYLRALKHIRIPTEKQYNSVLNSMGGDASKANNYFEEKLNEIVSEIQILNKLSERGAEHIVRYYENDIEVVDTPRRYDVYILMEYLTPLEDYIATHDFTVRDVVSLGKDVLTGLKVCHQSGIIHRDIKDDNIFVSDSNGYKIGDFGVSKVLRDSAKAESLKGTPNYLAPEVYLGKVGYTASVDLYSLGIVLYRLLNYERNPFLPPFPEQYFSQDEDLAFEKRMEGGIPSKPQLGGEEIGNVIVKSISDSDSRYHNAEDFLLDLDAAVSKTDSLILDSTVKFKIEDNKKSISENEQDYRDTLGETPDPVLYRNYSEKSVEGPSINDHLFDSIGEKPFRPVGQGESKTTNQCDQVYASQEIRNEKPSYQVVTSPPVIDDEEIIEPIDRNTASKAVYALPIVMMLIGVIAYFVIIPSIYGQVISFIDWLVSDPQNIIYTLQDPDFAIGKTNYLIAIKAFWYVWTAGFIASLYFVGRQLQKKPEQNALNAILVKKEPYLLAQDIVAEIKKVELGKDNKEFKQFGESVKRLEERLSVESDFGIGKPSVIKCENEIAKQLQYILENVPNITSGDVYANTNELSKAVTNINSLMRKRIELKRK